MVDKKVDQKIELIGPPFEYGGDEEAYKPCICGECGQTISQNKKTENQWPNPKAEVDDKD